jgi:hypothetical protein
MNICPTCGREPARDAVLEEAAKVCEACAQELEDEQHPSTQDATIGAYLLAAAAIRALKTSPSPKPAPLWGTGWICGRNYRQRGKPTGTTGIPDGEPWYITEDGTSWSAFDVTYRPDKPEPEEKP